MDRTLPLALVVLLAAAAHAQPLFPFDAPWAAYNTSTSRNGGDPVAFATGDFDGDGDPDVVTTRGRSEFGGSGFYFLRNDGRGRLAQPVAYTGPSNTWGIAAADFNADGDLDVAVSNGNYLQTSGNTVSVYLGNGNGTFAAAQTVSVGTGTVGPHGLAAADFDSDGALDLAVAAYGYVGSGSTVVLLYGDGAGGFSAPVAFPAGNAPLKLVAADLTGDGRPDLVVSVEDYGVSVLRNEEGTGFASPVIYEGAPGSGIDYTSVAVGDAEGDGDLDVFAPGLPANERGRILVYRNNGTGTLTQSGHASLPVYTVSPWDVAAADLTGDGRADLLGAIHSARTSDGVVVALNDGVGNFGEGTFNEGTRYPGGQATYAVGAADMDGDGATDVLTTDDYSMAVTVRLNEGDGRFPAIPDDATGALENDLDAADVDADGDLDVFTSGAQGSVLKNDGTGRFGNRQTIAIPFEGVHEGVLRDLDGDGRPDLLFNNAPSNNAPYDFFVALNNGDGSFPQPTRVPVGSCGWGYVDAFDLDNDGDLDIVDTEALGGPGCDEGRFWIALNDGDGSFGQPYPYRLLPQRPDDVAGGDFNHDGNVDLAFCAWGAYGYETLVMVVLGRGDGTFGPPTSYTVARGPRRIITADLDGDGHLDLATGTTGYDDGAFYVGEEKLTTLFGTGAGTFNRIQTYYAPFSPDLLATTGVQAGDVDADGDLDLMLAAASNDIALYVNDGSGGFSFPYRLGFTRGASDPHWGDFTGDGIPDLAAIADRVPLGFDKGVAVLRGITGASSAPVAVAAQPVNPPVVIGAGGGAFQFTVTLMNTTAQPQSFEAWTSVSGPVSRSLVLGPQAVTLPPGATVTRTLTQQVPAQAPAGTYTYAVNVGDYPGVVAASASFPVTKQGGALASREGLAADAADGWAVSGWDEPAARATASPPVFALSEASPNPAVGPTRLTLSLPEAEVVTVTVYDGLGRRVALLHEGTLASGTHALVLDGSALPPGVYVVRATGETFSAKRRVTLLR